MDLASQRFLQQRRQHDPLFLLLPVLSYLPNNTNGWIIYPKQWLNMHWISMDLGHLQLLECKDQCGAEVEFMNNFENNTDMWWQNLGLVRSVSRTQNCGYTWLRKWGGTVHWQTSGQAFLQHDPISTTFCPKHIVLYLD